MDKLIKHYDDCFRKYGDCHKGVDWPNENDACIRYQVMLQGIPHRLYTSQKKFSLLDYGCGLGHFYEFLGSLNVLEKTIYNGCDASVNMINHCKAKYPEDIFYLCHPYGIDKPSISYDYIICNGVFTEKLDYTYDEMFQFTSSLMLKLFESCNKGMILNFMSTNVDWCRDDLFHLPLDQLSSFVCNNMSRHFIIRNDYGLYEYTIYIYRTINDSFAVS